MEASGPRILRQVVKTIIVTQSWMVDQLFLKWHEIGGNYISHQQSNANRIADTWAGGGLISEASFRFQIQFFQVVQSCDAVLRVQRSCSGFPSAFCFTPPCCCCCCVWAWRLDFQHHSNDTCLLGSGPSFRSLGRTVFWHRHQARICRCWGWWLQVSLWLQKSPMSFKPSCLAHFML